MVRFQSLKTTLTYARLGLVSLSAVIVPITATAQELCGLDLFAGEPDAVELMNQTIVFLDILETEGVSAFLGREGRISITDARQALQDGIGSASLLACVIDAEAIEFTGELAGGENGVVVSCNSFGAASVFTPHSAETGPSERPEPAAFSATPVALGPVIASGRSNASLFCTTEVAAFAAFMGSQA